MAKVAWNGDEDECWEWQGAVQSAGYGNMGVRGGRTDLVHRISYREFVGPIGANMTIDHLCENKLCVNPAHLESVPEAVNNLRGSSPPAQNAQKTHCPQGHPYDQSNGYVNPTTGYRQCRKCQAAHLRGMRRHRIADERKKEKQDATVG